MTKTLRKIHDDLNLQQSLKIYTRNTNRKYNTDFTADEELSAVTYLLIKFNTLGKLRHHEEQFNLMEDYLSNKRDLQLYKSINETQSKRLEQAVSEMEKADLKDRYIEHLNKQTEFLSINVDYGFMDNIKDSLKDYFESKGLKYYQYMNWHGLNQWFEDRKEWFESELSK